MRIEVAGDRLLAYTSAEELLPALCSRPRTAQVEETGAFLPAVLASAPRGWIRPVAARNQADPPPALYTKQQALAGKALFAEQCVSCHGKNLQGTAAPGVAGTDFLQTARRNGWTLEDMRSIVFYNMPFNAPGSLSAEQYAQLMAYLLAENCYPPGREPFPTQDDPSLANVPLHVMPRDHKDASTGVCELK
jgi:mono/diheme cytochrome c family protein